MKQLFIPILCLLTLASQSRAQDDDQLAQLLVGSWESVGEEQAPNGTIHLLYDFTYNNDGQYHGTVGMTFPPAPGQATSGVVSITGTWQIESGKLSCHVVQVYPPTFASLFPDSSLAIQFIGRNAWKFVGETRVARRTQ